MSVYENVPAEGFLVFWDRTNLNTTIFTQKAILIITGAWHVPQHYHKVIHIFESKGIRVLAPCLPTNNGAVPPNRGIGDDIALIKSIAAEEAAKGTHLYVLAHSYGGMIATAALAKFTITPGSRVGGVASIVFMAAFVPLEGQSLAGMFGGQFPPYLATIPETQTIEWSDPIDHLYNDLPPEEARWAESLRVAHSHAAQYTPIECEIAAWRVFPVSYLLCENDQAMPPFVQESMIETLRGNKADFQTFRCEGSHSLFLSLLLKVAEVVLSVMGIGE
ncbi:Alpha/beta hydrolase nvfD-like protein [Cladobotryum mycophilum]|uniref:Alpha/beta hydrolase nvfD-like protein n=1 Tax=Cladobotryum mycophilum TaxID=491253 RepID=A0ABR0T4Z2_9HYPO